jgi:hypothetical protein
MISTILILLTYFTSWIIFPCRKSHEKISKGDLSIFLELPAELQTDIVSYMLHDSQIQKLFKNTFITRRLCPEKTSIGFRTQLLERTSYRFSYLGLYGRPDPYPADEQQAWQKLTWDQQKVKIFENKKLTLIQLFQLMGVCKNKRVV